MRRGKKPRAGFSKKAGFENTYYLGYRDIPCFIKKYAKGTKAIDYGCGTGRSTRFLQALGFDTIGVDISRDMLIQASSIDQNSHYLLLNNQTIPVLDGSYDLFLSCFVFFALPSKETILAILQEIYRCLKSGGIFIIVTGSEQLYSHDWLSYNVNYPENMALQTGCVTKIQLKDLGIHFINYYWKDSDYSELFDASGFNLIEKHFPMGKPEDNIDWISENKYPPYVVYVLQKA